MSMHIVNFCEIRKNSDEIDCEGNVRGLRLCSKVAQSVDDGMDDAGREKVGMVMRIIDKDGECLNGIRFGQGDGAE